MTDVVPFSPLAEHKAAVAEYLPQFIQAHLPIAQHLQVGVEHYDSLQLALNAPLGPSVNDKLTAFGGSIYCLMVMTCWGMVYLRCKEYGIEPNIVVAHGEIDYLSPVDGDFISHSLVVDEGAWSTFFAKFEDRGRAQIPLSAELVHGGKLAARFSGRYAIIGAK